MYLPIHKQSSICCIEQFQPRVVQCQQPPMANKHISLIEVHWDACFVESAKNSVSCIHFSIVQRPGHKYLLLWQARSYSYTYAFHTDFHALHLQIIIQNSNTDECDPQIVKRELAELPAVDLIPR